MGIWHPGRWYPTCCDFSCMISTQMYEELVVGELLEELDFLDASIYHLDGPDALKHLDRLLAIDNGFMEPDSPQPLIGFLYLKKSRMQVK